MFSRNLLFLLLVLSLAIFSSCGIIKIDTSVAVDQFTDFSPKESAEVSHEDSSDCGCVQIPINTLRPSPVINPPEPICGYIYAPVCGFNGITYRNACEARIAGVNTFFKGKCR